LDNLAEGLFDLVFGLYFADFESADEFGAVFLEFYADLSEFRWVKAESDLSVAGGL